MLIALINNSVRYRNNLGILRRIAEAVDKQLSVQVALSWGVGVWNCQLFEDVSKVPVGAYRLVIFDSSDQANALGYHGQDSLGNAYGRVFVNPIILNGGTDTVGNLSVSVTVSHEACEIMLNPEINCWRQDRSGILYSQELCDAVQGDSYNIMTSGGMVSVSNFLLPSWFDYAPMSGSKFDFMGKLSKPFSIGRGGYVIMMRDGRISNKFGSIYDGYKFAYDDSKFHIASRGMRVRSMNGGVLMTRSVVLQSLLSELNVSNIIPSSEVLSFLNLVSVGRVSRLQSVIVDKEIEVEVAESLVSKIANEISDGNMQLEQLRIDLQSYLDQMVKLERSLVDAELKLADLESVLSNETDPVKRGQIQLVIDETLLFINNLRDVVIPNQRALIDKVNSDIVVLQGIIDGKDIELGIATSNAIKLRSALESIVLAINAAL